MSLVAYVYCRAEFIFCKSQAIGGLEGMGLLGLFGSAGIK